MAGIDGLSCQHLQVFADAAAAEASGVAGGQGEERMARQRKETHHALCQHGQQDGLRRGKTKAHCEN